jgi:drug/metabolite transporter (DMT)-like permease
MPHLDAKSHVATRILPLLALVACAFLWSTGGLLIKSVSLSPVATAGSRSLIAAMFLVAIVRGRPDFRGGLGFWAAAAANATTMLLFVVATRLTTAANAVLLQYTAPVWVVLLGWILYREKVLRIDLAVVGIVMAGMALFFAESLSLNAGPQATLGDMLAVVSGITFGMQALLIRRQRKGSPVSVILAGNLLVFLLTLPSLIGETFRWSDLLPLMLLGVFQIGVAYLLFSYAVKHLTALELILVPILEPLLNPLWVFLVRGEAPSTSAIAGGGVILVTVTAWCLLRDGILRRNYPLVEARSPESVDVPDTGISV